MRSWGWALLAALTLGGGAGADSAAWHGPWRGLDLYVIVITRGHGIPRVSGRPAGEWWRWGNAATDAYLFGFGRPGADLILDFSTVGGTPQASLFVVDPAQRETVYVDEEGYRLPPGTLPRLTLRPVRDGWWVGNRPNFDLRGTHRDLTDDAGSLRTVTYDLRVGGRTPGEPDWTTSVVTDPPGPGGSYTHFGAAVRSDPTVPYELAPPLLPGFPYLSAREYYDFYGPNQPVMFETGSGRLLQRFVGFQSAGIYSLNSYAPPPRLAFEAPFAWYRFDPGIGRFPNLVVRVEQFPRGSTLAAYAGTQRTAVRLSWTGADSRTWRYSLSVAGDHPLNQRVQVGGTLVFSVPYARLPGWTTSRAWGAASFVEATRGLQGSEGLYSYSVEANPALFPWLAGRADAPPDTFRAPYLGGLSIVDPHQLPEGYRGEYSLAYRRAPGLYFSAIDRRVHLAYAAAGLWNLGGGYVLRTHNVTAGRAINAWLLERVAPGERRAKTPRAYKTAPVQSLYALGGHLLYSDARGAVIRRAALPPDVPLPVPDRRAHWQTFLRGAGGARPTRDPRDLRGWLRDFGGPTLTVPGGSIRSLRVTPGGFRFVLTVPEGAAVSTQGSLPGLPRLGAGRYVLGHNVRTGRWIAAPATPAAVRGRVQVTRAREFEPTELTLTLGNSGTLDRSGPAALFVDGQPVREWDNLTVPGGGLLTRRVTWSPRRGGPVRVALRWRQGFVNVRANPEGPARPWQGPAADLGTVRVEETPRVEGYAAVALSSPRGPTPGGALLLGILALGACSVWRIWRRLP